MVERKGEKIFEELKKKDYMTDRYNTSKLLEIFVVRELAEAMTKKHHDDSEKVTLNTVNPGFCHSELLRDRNGFQGLFLAALKYTLARTTEVGGRTLVAGGVAGPESHGHYMTICATSQPSSFVTSEEGNKTQKRVYTELCAILEQIEPGILKNI